MTKKPACPWKGPFKTHVVETISGYRDVRDSKGVYIHQGFEDEAEAICYALNRAYPVKPKKRRKP